jgi:SLT domain-containing protein
MSFDAGTIIAHLDLDPSAFERKLREEKANSDAFEKAPHKVKLSAAFDTADMSKARRMFAQFDQQISRDAAQRLRAGGTGSVLGALNALFSPQQISGSPSAQQASQQGLLGRMVRQGGTVAGSTAASSTSSGGGGVTAGRLLTSLVGGIGGGGGGGGGSRGGGGGNQGLGTGLFQGIGPGILGIGTRVATIGALGASALGALPAVGALGAGLGALGGGAAFLIATNKQVQASAKSMLSQVEATFKQATGPLIKPLEAAFSQLAGFFKSIGPELKDVFQVSAPLMKPLLDGLESLVKGLLPGLINIIHGAAPVFNVFAKFLGELGSDLGSALTIMTPVLKASSVIFGSLLSVLSGLFPVIARLAAIFASSLAPVFSDFAAVVKSLMPVLIIVGGILASLAKAVLADLVSAFGAVAKLLIAISPSLQMFAKSLGAAFQILENSGVFATLGDALEQITPLLAGLVNLILKQLSPFLPQLIGLFGQLSAVMINLFAAGLGTILKGLTLLLTQFPFLSKLLLAAAAAWVVFDVAADANPIGLIVVAIVALIGAGTLLVTHWKQVWGDVKQWAEDAWKFLTTGWGQYLIPGLTLIVKTVEFVRDNWKTVWDDIESITTTVINFLKNSWNTITTTLKQAWNAISSFFISWWNAETSSFRSALSAVESVLSAAWSAVLGAVRTAWNTIAGAIKTVLSTISSNLKTWGSSLVNLGKAAITDFWNGLKSIASSVVNWFKSFGSDIKKVFTNVLGVLSPSKVFFDIGRNLMQGLINGIKSHTSQVKGTVTAVGTSVAGWIEQALKRTGTSLSWLSGLVKLVTLESGGNPNAVNPATAGASGEHAEGIAQTIPSTFAAYSLGGSIFDPVANLVASIRYIKAEYGSVYSIPGILGGTYGGYDSGGWLNPGLLNNTGQPEAVLTPSQSAAFMALAESARSGNGPSGSLDAKLDMLIAAITSSASRTGAAMGLVLNQAATGAAARAYYAPGAR